MKIGKFICTVAYGQGHHTIRASFDTPEQLAAYEPHVFDPRTRPKGQRRGAIPVIYKWQRFEEPE